MSNKRQKHTAQFKAKVAIAAVKEDKTLAELEAQFGVSQTMISRWKGEFLRNAA